MWPHTEGEEYYSISFRNEQQLTSDQLMQYVTGAGSDLYIDDLAPSLSGYNIIFARYPRKSQELVSVGKHKHFPLNSGHHKLGLALEAVRGFYTSLRPQSHGITLNVNVCTSAFVISNLLDVLQELRRNTQLPDDIHREADIISFITGLQVQSDYEQRGNYKTLKVTGISNLNAMTSKFRGSDETVREYFRSMWRGVHLQRPGLSLIKFAGPEGQQALLLPAECMQVLPGQSPRGKLLPPACSAAMIIQACKTPVENARMIAETGLPSLGLNAQNQYLRNFGIMVSDEMAVVPMRKLVAPAIQYNSARVSPQPGRWNARNQTVFSAPAPRTKIRWSRLVVCIDGAARPQFAEVANLEKKLQAGINAVGLATGVEFLASKTPDHFVKPTDAQSFETTVQQLTDSFQRASAGKIGVLVIMFSGNGRGKRVSSALYSAVKYLGDIKFGIQTICSVLDKFQSNEKGQDQYVANLLLKFNLKLGGINHRAVLGMPPGHKFDPTGTMIMGADVTHPGPASVPDSPSIAAVVGSCDRGIFTNFPGSVSLQQSRKEMITDMRQMVRERIAEYRRVVGSPPSKIIFYRDGVSESQYATVMEDEVPQIRQACREEGIQNVMLTLAIVGKRHHTRFFPVDERDVDQTGNPQPGSIVDRGVTDIYDFDFFLQAHQGLKGTARPCHYYVLVDDNKFTADAFQNLTYQLCYNFARATRSVSVCTPAYYADILCERARCYIIPLLSGAHAQKYKAGGKWIPDRAPAVMKGANDMMGAGVHPNVRNTMYYL
ncbi:Piwi domain-containing protein [Sphaerosporella brunnea]|uniref:Piwi domain-containing protein n=1 Tax=Sphaerosporella brunnea TaxID=1250544 RepID=A0A5J5EHM4_9PEZI|nr:Piwi domain-containing protein [Sphaerosporella brunnea]